MTRNEKPLAVAKKALCAIAHLECSLEDAPGLARAALAQMAGMKRAARREEKRHG